MLFGITERVRQRFIEAYCRATLQIKTMVRSEGSSVSGVEFTISIKF